MEKESTMSDLLVINDQGGDFKDFSKPLRDYLRDQEQLIIESGNSSLYIGLYKPFNSVYVELTRPMDAVAVIDLQFTINGSNVDLDDDTNGFKRSGFMQFTKPENWSATTVDGKEAFWLKIDSAADNIDVDCIGLNIVFSDDNDLRSEVREIDKMLASGDTSFISYHLSARNEIIQTLRNGGRFKQDDDDQIKNLTKWDVLDFGEIRQASKYLALSKIHFDTSLNVDDKNYQRFRDYEGMFGKAFNLYIMNLDKNDDGKKEQEEDLIVNSIEIEIL